MESLYLIKCHRILDHHPVEVAVETVVNTATKDHSAIFTKALVLKMFMFATSGDQDILKDNGIDNLE